jgi:hypothetical protein
VPDGKQRTIRAAAEKLRWALERVSPNTWASVTIDSFPRGACGHCAELLARYLKDNLAMEAIYASGHVGHIVDGGTHAWLEYDGLFIDISADQFGLPAVIVERHSNLHEEATDIDRHPIIQDHWWGKYAAPVYREAMELINAF